jgi:hypothetical protein
VLSLTSVPAANGAAYVADAMELGGLTGSGFGVGVSQTSAEDLLRILASELWYGVALSTADLAAETRTPIPNTPVQAGGDGYLFIPDTEIHCIDSGDDATCNWYWLETNVNTSGECVSAKASIWRRSPALPANTDLLFAGAPLRCPVALARAPSGDMMVLDALLDGLGGTAHHLRLYRLDYEAGEWSPVLPADETELGDANTGWRPASRSRRSRCPSRTARRRARLPCWHSPPRPRARGRVARSAAFPDARGLSRSATPCQEAEAGPSIAAPSAGVPVPAPIANLAPRWWARVRPAGPAPPTDAGASA